MKVKDHHSLQELRVCIRMERDARVARRVQIVAWAKEGRTAPVIGQLSGDDARTVQRWVRRYNQQSLEGLKDRPRSGRKPKIPKDKEQALQERLDAGPTQADGVTTFTGRHLRGVLEREFGVIYSLDGVYKLLHRLGYSWLMPRPRHERADAAAQEAFKKTRRCSSNRSSRTIRTRPCGSTSRTKPALVSRVR